MPVATAGDAADDPAIWAHPTDPSRSAVIGNDKGGALEVYDLSGARIQRISEGFFGNVDVRKGFVTGTGPIDLVVTYRLGVRVYRIDPATRQLTNATDTASGSIAAPFNGDGLTPDVEGLTIVYQPGGTGYLLASSQAASNTLNSYIVYERQGTNAFIRTFKVVNGASVDGCGRTDGMDALAADLGPSFPNGMFVCQDNNNTIPGGTTGNQNFNFVPLERGRPGRRTGPRDDRARWSSDVEHQRLEPHRESARLGREVGPSRTGRTRTPPPPS